MRLKENKSGQGMVEALIAVAILVTGVTTTVVLGVTTIRAGQVAQNRTIADNLAREGIEHVRHIRDTNWLNTSSNWYDQFCPIPGDYTAILEYNPIILAWNLDFIFNDMTDPQARIFLEEGKEADEKFAYYFQTDQANPPAGTLTTPFRRLLTITPKNDIHQTVDCSSAVYFLVQTSIEWNEKGATHNSTLIEHLYNWKT